MKPLILATAILFSASACASPPHRHSPRYEHHPGIGWVIPTIIGGALVYQLTNRPVQTQPPQVIYVERPTPTPMYVAPPPQYERKSLWDPACGCYIEAYVPK